MSQVVSRWPVTSEARLQSQACLCGICCGLSGSGMGFSPSTPVFGDSAVGRATCYRLDGPGIESRCGRYFPRPSRPAVSPNQPPMQWLPGLSRG